MHSLYTVFCTLKINTSLQDYKPYRYGLDNYRLFETYVNLGKFLMFEGICNILWNVVTCLTTFHNSLHKNINIEQRKPNQKNVVWTKNIFVPKMTSDLLIIVNSVDNRCVIQSGTTVSSFKLVLITLDLCYTFRQLRLIFKTF